MSKRRVRLSALGVSVDIVLKRSMAPLEARLLELWASCLRNDDAEPDIVLTPGGVDGGLDDLSTQSILAELTQSVTVEAIGAQAGNLLMLHACALAGTDGRAALLVGPSGMGKTTAARTLGERWSYVTDETVAIDESGSILAYPKPLAIVTDGGPKAQRSPHELGLTPLSGAGLTVGATFLLDRVPGLEAAEVVPVATVEALALLAPHTSHLADLDAPLHRLAELASSRSIAVLRYTEAHQLPAVLVSELGRPEEDS